MLVIRQSIAIDAPLKRVFGILEDFQRVPEYVPGIDRINQARLTDSRIGDFILLTYEVLGFRLPVRVTLTEHVEDQCLVTSMEGSIQGTCTWLLEQTPSAVLVEVQVVYRVRTGFIATPVNMSLLTIMNEKNIERMLENLKLISEVDAAIKAQPANAGS